MTKNWLEKQLEQVEKEVSAWPDWMKEVSVSCNYEAKKVNENGNA